MTTYKLEASCDICKGKFHTDATGTKEEMIRRLRGEGWSVGKKVICPDCKLNQTGLRR